MSPLTGNHTMDLKENFKNLLFDLLTTERSFENLSYLSSCSLSQRRGFWRIRSNLLRGTELDLAYTKVYRVVSQYILWSGSLWHPLSSSMFKNEWIFLLVISKLMPVFSLWLYNVVKPKIISINASLKNTSRSLRGVTVSSSVLNLGMFDHPTSRLAQFISKRGGFR